MFKIGDKIVFRDRDENEGLIDVTFDKVYTIAGFDNYDDAPYFLDDVNEQNYAGGDEGADGICELVNN